MLLFLERMLRSQFDSYNNFLARKESKYSARIAEASYNDSLSMKTISYLTMVFFPITFVSAIFSTSIFDFQQWDAAAASSEVISPGW
jgi:Mg2+ and Co2+ transporter CorA